LKPNEDPRGAPAGRGERRCARPELPAGKSGGTEGARTKDAGKPCRNRLDCEHLCITNNPPRLGSEVVGECTAVKTPFGCFTHVDGGKIVGRVCAE